MNRSSQSSSSSVALRRLLSWLELRYGGNIPMERVTEVITVPKIVDDHHNLSHHVSDPTTGGTSNDDFDDDQHQRRIRRLVHTNDLIRLMQHDPGVIAIHIKEFYPYTAAIQLGQQLAYEAEYKSKNWNIHTNRGVESSDVMTMGAYPPYNVVVSSSSSSLSSSSRDNEHYNPKMQLLPTEDDYFRGVTTEHYERRRRNALGYTTTSSGHNDVEDEEPFLWPLDLLRLQLDEAWPSGAGLARRYSNNDSNYYHDRLASKIYNNNNNPPFGGGLPRIMYGPTRYTKGFIHVDEMGPLHINHGLFSANIYLQLPDVGMQTTISDDDKDRISSSGSGDDVIPSTKPRPQDVLEIWPTRIMKRWDWYRNMILLSGLSSTNIDDQIRLRNELGPPVRVAVSPGDLILFCVQRPHAAIGFLSGTRVSLQCFIQHHGIHKRLLIDS